MNYAKGGRLRQLQAESARWREANFSAASRDAVRQALGVAEESGELAHAVLKLDQGIRGTPDKHLAEAADAAGDIIIYLAGACTALGLDLEECVMQAWKQVSERDWVADPESGVRPDTGTVCDACGGMMIRTPGSGYTCTSCGNTA